MTPIRRAFQLTLELGPERTEPTVRQSPPKDEDPDWPDLEYQGCEMGLHNTCEDDCMRAGRIEGYDVICNTCNKPVRNAIYKNIHQPRVDPWVSTQRQSARRKQN